MIKVVNRCNVCKKKISLAENEFCRCKCGGTFCILHRHAGNKEEMGSHLCTFDHFIENKDQLAKQLNENKISKKDIIGLTIN